MQPPSSSLAIRRTNRRYGRWSLPTQARPGNRSMATTGSTGGGPSLETNAKRSHVFSCGSTAEASEIALDDLFVEVVLLYSDTNHVREAAAHCLLYLRRRRTPPSGSGSG